MLDKKHEKEKRPKGRVRKEVTKFEEATEETYGNSEPGAEDFPVQR